MMQAGRSGAMWGAASGAISGAASTVISRATSNLPPVTQEAAKKGIASGDFEKVKAAVVKGSGKPIGISGNDVAEVIVDSPGGFGSGETIEFNLEPIVVESGGGFEISGEAYVGIDIDAGIAGAELVFFGNTSAEQGFKASGSYGYANIGFESGWNLTTKETFSLRPVKNGNSFWSANTSRGCWRKVTAPLSKPCCLACSFSCEIRYL